ncbi:NLI interacting factor-like phosphatase family protein, putative, partial [Ichthyophthirius multifiliis]
MKKFIQLFNLFNFEADQEYQEQASTIGDNNYENQQKNINKNDKKTLVLDLDETLVHSSFVYMQNSDFQLEIFVQDIRFIVYVKKRPGCELFLEELSKYYEIIIFTASLSEYANPVIDLIDKKKVTSIRLFRENCTLYNGFFVKDLSKLERQLKDIIIIDNSENSFLFQPENAIHILSFFEDMNDDQLYRLIPVLIFLSN